MRQLLAAALIAVSVSFPFASLAAEVAPAVDPAVDPLVAPAPASTFVTVQSTGVPTAFQQAVNLRGNIGDDRVQVTIRPKVPADEGFEGEYFFFGQSMKVLIAGDIDGELLQLEESQDGTHISGEWDGVIAGDKITGNWMSADGSVTKPFALQIVPPVNATAISAKKPTAKQ